LQPLHRSPLDVPQQLCTVQVRKRRVACAAVGGGSVKLISEGRLRFASFERGLEWDRQRSTPLPPEKLPPLHHVMGMAVKEFGIKFPLKKAEPRGGKERHKKNPEKGSAHSFSRYLGGPRLPVRGRCLDVPISPVTVEVVAPVEERVSQVAEETAESKTQVDVPPAGTGSTLGESAAGASEDALGVTAVPSEKPEEVFDDDSLPFPWSTDELRSAFSKFDTDRDGELHTEELPTLLQYLGARPQTGDVDKIVKAQTRYSTLSYEEVVEFLHHFRRLDVKRLYELFCRADQDGSGELDFDELHLLLQELGYYPTTQSTLEAFEALDKDKSATIRFREFEGLREYLRVTEGFTKMDFLEIVTLHSKSNLAKEGPQEVAEETWRITMYLGYSAPLDQVRQFCDQVDPERSGCMNPTDLVKVIRLLREAEIADMIRTMARHSPKHPTRLPCEDLGLALTDLGYHVSEDAVNEILDNLGECESEEWLTLEEFGAFLRAYRRTEGFTQAELAELQETFLQEGRLEEGALHTLEVGKVLRWFGFARTVQQVQRLLEEVDLDGSGVIEFTEFVKLMRRLHTDEAERRQQIFFELATESPAGVLEVHVEKFADAIALLTEAEADPELVEAAAKMMIAELQGRRHSRTSVDESGENQVLFVNKLGLETFFKHHRRLAIQEIRANAGFSLAEKAWLQEVFDEYDANKGGTIDRAELMQLIKEYFPDATKSKEAQEDVRKALEEVDQDGNGELDFSEFLLLTRKCDDARDSRDMQLEAEVARECGFTTEEVDGFRQIFSANVDMRGEVDLATLANILGRVVELSENDLRDLSSLVCEVHPQGREVARFPQFLRLIKRLTEANYAHLNDQAARFLRRQQQLQAQRRASSKSEAS